MIPYEPLNTPKPVAPNVWIVDGPVIRFGPPLLKMPFTTRMCIVRIGNGDLLIHSPTPLTSDLAAKIAELGTPRWIVGPNRLHYWWIPEWHAAFPRAQVHLAPGTAAQARGRIGFATLPLDADNGFAWDGDLATLPIVGSFMTEVVFFHRPSRTLILADLIENFEPERIGSWAMRLLVKLGGVRHPDGAMPRDLRLTFRRRRAALRAAVDTMIAWDPVRIIVAHGRWYAADGTRELRRAFRWLR